MNPIPLVRKTALAPAISYLAAEGVKVSRYLRSAGLSISSPGDQETLIPLHQACRFLSTAARTEGIDDLGFRIAGHCGIESLGLFGRLIAQSLTLHDALQTSLELISSYNSGLKIWAEMGGDQVRYYQRYVGRLPQDQVTEIVHLGLANAVACLKHALGPNWQPSRLEIASDPVDLTTHFPQFTDLTVSFNQPHTSVWLDQTVLSASMPSFDASCFPPVGERERERFVGSAPASEPTEQLEQAIESVVGHPDMNLQLTAAIIGTSTRTLQRRLTERGLSFSRLLQGVRFRNAQELLQHRGMTLTEIASRVGYTDVANFIRAFKRWTGVGPNDYRRLHLGD